MIAPGDKIPEVTLQAAGADGIRQVSTRELFAGKKAVLFGVPGAFTPTCSDHHLPGFLARSDDLRARGVELIACVAVNDAHVMRAWGKASGAGDHLLLLADGNGELARAMGLAVDLSRFGMGGRSRRFAAVLQDGVVTLLNVEPGPGVTVSAAEAILRAL
jgi:peroxiredoxin